MTKPRAAKKATATKERKLAVKKETVADLTPRGRRAEAVKGGVTYQRGRNITQT